MRLHITSQCTLYAIILLQNATPATFPAALPPKPTIRMEDVHNSFLEWDLEAHVLQPSRAPSSKPATGFEQSGQVVPVRFKEPQQYVHAFR